MSKKEKPLPTPPKTPFGRRRPEENKEDRPLMADRMAAAMAEGRLEEFMKEEIPDNEYARALAGMMMGMTGMMPGAFSSPSPDKQEECGESKEEVKEPEDTAPAADAPEDIVRAVHSGDVRGVMEALAREHKNRTPEAVPHTAEEEAGDAAGLSSAEKEALDQLMKIASENSVSVDWIVLRALRLYVSEYKRTGRL